MFHTNARIERSEGIRFYEKDILRSNYLFTNDITMELEIDYLSPGAGIVLLEENDKSLDESSNEIFVFKIGINDFTVIRQRYGNQDIMLHVSNSITPPHHKLPLTFIKRGRSIEMKSGERLIGHYTLPKGLDKYHIGLYSNAGNTFKSVSFATGMPNKWMVNIKNTNGGRVFFFKDGFHIENCERDAEVEQDNVFLEKGIYYLEYDEKPVRGEIDIDSFVFMSDDERFEDRAKTLLKSDGSFELLEDGYVSVKFKGTSGQIENISIKNNTKDSYVSTDDLPVVTNGSSMIITLDGLESVKWRGTIHSVPDYDDLTDVRDYGVVTTKVKNYLLGDLAIDLDKEYTYILDVKTMRLDVYNEKELHRSQIILITDQDQGKITAFRNMNAIINQLIIKRTNGEEVDILLQKTSKVYVPATVKGPIVVTDKHYIPLNISSSYRVSKEGSREDLMLFTNWEREVFNSSERMIFENEIIDAHGNIKVYGIQKESNTDIRKIYDISKDIDTIDLYANHYSIITEDLFVIDYYNNEIKLSDEIKDKYKEIVVDYQKENSYCVNYIKDLHAYEVDISTSEETIYVMYDYFFDEEGFGAVSEYHITDISPDTQSNKYIVLRKE